MDGKEMQKKLIFLSSVFLRVPSLLFSHPLPVFLCVLCVLCGEISFPEIPEDPIFLP